MSRTKLAIIIAAAVCLVAVILVAVIGVPAGYLTDRVQTSFETETGFRLRIAGPVKIGLWPSLTVAANDIAVSDPTDLARPEKFTAEQVRAEVSLRSLLSGPIKIEEIAIKRPVAYVPMARERSVPRNTSSSKALPSFDASRAELSRVMVEDGTLVLYDTKEKTENRFDGIQVTAVLFQPEGRFDVSASGKAGDQKLKLSIKSAAPVKRIETPFPIDATVEAPGLLEAPLVVNADASLAGDKLTIDALRGKIGPHSMDGAVAVDFASVKPFVTATLNFQRLTLASPAPAKPLATPGSTPEPWSDKPFKLGDLNYFDAEVSFSAGEFSFDKFKVAPLALKATLANGVATVTISQAEMYGGRLAAAAVVDASRATLGHAARIEISEVQAYPFLSDVAEFQSLNGRMNAKFELQALGNSARAIAGSLSGKAEIGLQDGEIRGLNVADMVRSLMSTILNGWQDNDAKKTDFSELKASFTAKDGQATTLDLNLAGPLVRMRGVGTVDLMTKMLSFRLDPKVVATLEGQGGQTDPLGLGVPVLVQGPWSAPQIYPDIAGIKDNPQAAFDKLRDLGTGLFSVFTGKDPKADGKGDQKSGGDDLVKSLNDMFGKKDSSGTGKDSKPSGDNQGGVGNVLRDLFSK